MRRSKYKEKGSAEERLKELEIKRRREKMKAEGNRNRKSKRNNR